MILTVRSNNDGATNYYRNNGWVASKDKAEIMTEEEATEKRDLYIALDSNNLFKFATKES